MHAVDTNVFLYSADRHEPVKQLKAQQCLANLQASSQPCVLLWQVVGELGQQLRRWRDQGRISAAEFQQYIQAFRNIFPIVLPTTAVFDQAILLADRHTLAHWDSMILGACLVAGVTKFYTEDMGAPATIAGIELVNPFT